MISSKKRYLCANNRKIEKTVERRNKGRVEETVTEKTPRENFLCKIGRVARGPYWAVHPLRKNPEIARDWFSNTTNVK